MMLSTIAGCEEKQPDYLYAKVTNFYGPNLRLVVMWRAPIGHPLVIIDGMDKIQNIVVVNKWFTNSHNNDMADTLILTTFIKVFELAWPALRFPCVEAAHENEPHLAVPS